MNTNVVFHKGLSRILSTALAILLLLSLFGQVNQPARAEFRQQEEPGKLETVRLEMQKGPSDQLSAALPTSTNSASTTTVHVIDVAIDQRTPNTSDWDGYELKAGYEGYQRQRFLVKPLLSSLPPNAVITSASLAFALGGWQDIRGYTRTFSFYRVTTPWHPNLTTWNNVPATGELVGTMQVDTPPSLDPAPWYSVNLTSVVQNWYQGGYPNYGLLVTGPEGGVPAFRIFGSNDAYCDYGYTYCGPTLTISYTLAPPTLSASSSISFLTDASKIPLNQQQVKISNSGSTELQWAIANKPAWLTLSRTSGVLGPNTSETITASASTAGMPYGTTSATFQVTSSTPGVVGAPANISATLNYLQNPGSLMYLPLATRAGASATYPSMVAVLVGISDYWNLGEASPAAAVGLRNLLKNTDLEHAADDIYAFNSLLASADAYMSNPADLKVITRTDLQATKPGILQAFQEAREMAGPNTRVLFYFSGHGLSYNNHLYMAPTEVSPDTSPLQDFLSDSELAQQLNQFLAGSIVILDTCQSGAAIPNMAQNGRLILTATQATEFSLESDELGQGAFSYYLNMAFMDGTADANHDGWVSYEEAFYKSKGFVTAYSNPQPQHPMIDDKIGGEVNLTRP